MLAQLTDLFKRWSTRISLSILDQILLSGANFILNVLLARWLIPDAYGAFAVAFSVFLFLSGIHNALIVDPMSVLGPARFGNRLPGYLTSLFYTHGGLTIGLSLLLFLVASLFFRASPLLLTALWGVALSLPLTLLFWLLRRACYVDMHVDVAVRSSLLYAVLLLVGLLVLSWNDWVSSFNAFIVIGLASLGASVGARYWLLRRWKSAVHDASRVALPVVLKEHWSYGRWVLGASVAHSISSAIFAPLVASFLGLAQAGAFRAMQNLVAPIQQVMTAMGVLLLPWMSKKHAEQGGTSLKGSIFKASLLNTAAVLSFALILGLFSDQLITLLYDDAYYNAFRWLLPYMLGALLVVALSQPVAVASRAMEKPSALLWSKLSASLCLLLVGLPLIWLENMQGVVITLVLVAFAEAFVLFHFLKKHIFRKPSSRTG